MTDTPPTTPDPGPALGPQEIAEGKAFAILSYVMTIIGLPFWLVPLVLRNNDFALFHAKQALVLWVILVIGWTAAGILSVACVGLVMLPIVAIASVVFNVLGLINAANGLCTPLPIIGPWAVDWFRGVRRVS